MNSLRQAVAWPSRKNRPEPVSASGRGGRVTKEDLVNYAKAPTSAPAKASAAPTPGSRPEERVPMTRMRAKIAERLDAVEELIAMLTSFNEINLAKVAQMRKQLGEQFEKTHGIKLGYMSFFVKAAAEALKRHPIVNASVDGNDVIYHGYQDISVAVSTDRGLVTPVLRDAQNMSFADIEKAIMDFAKARAKAALPSKSCKAAPLPSPTAARSARRSRHRSSTRRRARFSACTRSRNAPWSRMARSLRHR